MSKRNPFTYEEHKAMGTNFQLCYNFLQSFYGAMEKSYGRNSKQCKALWRAIVQLDEVKNQMDSQVFKDHPAPSNMSEEQAYQHNQDLMDTYYCNHRVTAEGKTISNLAAHTE